MGRVRTRKRGKTYSYIFEAGKDENGKRRVVEKGGFDSEDAAYDAGIEAYTSFKHGDVGVTSERITFGKFVELWLDHHKTNVRETTHNIQSNFIKRHILPQLGKIPIQDLRPAVINKWQDELIRAGLAAKTISTIRTILHNILNYAVFPAELIQSNPVNYVPMPKVAEDSIVVKRSIVTPEQYADILEKAPFGSTYHIPLQISYHTGMRLGEIIGLQWENVDLEHGLIYVRTQVVPSERAYKLTNKLKTKTSRRTIPIDNELIELLTRWKALQEERAAANDGYIYNYTDPDGRLRFASRSTQLDNVTKVNFVCTAPTGRYMPRASYTNFLQKRCGGLNSHSFRHTHATMLIEAGASPKGVALRLGHKDATITQNLYTHGTEKMQQDVLEIFKKTQTKNADK